MSEQSHIEWTGATWPVVVGCERVSPGCDHCYAIRDGWRMGHNPNPKVRSVYGGLVAREEDGRKDWTGTIRCLERRLDWPRHWKPRRIFVCSQSDLFHDEVPDDFLSRVWATMASCPHHTFQVLTKRPGRMRDWFRRSGQPALPNVWLGTSIENDAYVWRAGMLRQCPAAGHFLSCEPLLGALPSLDLTDIEWVITGGESGPDDERRPFDPAWARNLRDRCLDEHIAYFHKQNGGRTAKAGGRLLDGATWDQYPDVAP